MASPAADGGRGKLRAADADRDRIAAILGTAYSEGRIRKDEYDARLDTALSARTYAELDQVVTDLPVQAAAAGPVAPMAGTPATRTNAFAIASLACGIGQFLGAGPLATVPAIVFGHMARTQIRRTGEQGGGLALAGLVLGWGAVIVGTVALITLLTVVSGMHPGSGMP